jgi:hypothetical protein
MPTPLNNKATANKLNEQVIFRMVRNAQMTFNIFSFLPAPQPAHPVKLYLEIRDRGAIKRAPADKINYSRCLWSGICRMM